MGNVYKGRKGFCFGMDRKQTRPGNFSVGKLMSDTRFTEGNTGAGKVKEGVLLREERRQDGSCELSDERGYGCTPWEEDFVIFFGVSCFIDFSLLV